jgi:hypothetical protein
MSSNISSTSSSECAEVGAYTCTTLRLYLSVSPMMTYAILFDTLETSTTWLTRALLTKNPTPPWDCCFPSRKYIRWSGSSVIVSSPSLRTSHNPRMCHLIFPSSTSSYARCESSRRVLPLYVAKVSLGWWPPVTRRFLAPSIPPLPWSPPWPGIAGLPGTDGCGFWFVSIRGFARNRNARQVGWRFQGVAPHPGDASARHRSACFR